jgi:hypothetical protein
MFFESDRRKHEANGGQGKCGRCGSGVSDGASLSVRSIKPTARAQYGSKLLENTANPLKTLGFRGLKRHVDNRG